MAASLRRGRCGFTLVEMLVALAVLALIMVLIVSITDQTSKVWKHSNAEIQAFQSARAAYDTMTLRLSQATLNTYLDYYDNESPPQSRTAYLAANPTGSFTPFYYARNSDLHFVVDQAATIVPAASPSATKACYPGQAVFFQAPLGFTLTGATYGGLPSMLNACGYYVEFNSDVTSFPTFLVGSPLINPRYRYRLMEFLRPTESNTIYGTPATGGPTQYDAWFTNFLPPKATLAANPSGTQAPLRVLAENIVALVILPEVAPQNQSGQNIAPNYTYDSRFISSTSPTMLTTDVSRNQLPPLLRIVMVAIDEPSAIRLNPPGSTAPPVFLSNLFQGGSPLFQTSANLNADLATLTGALAQNHVNFRVFDTDVAIRGAQWSTQ